MNVWIYNNTPNEFTYSLTLKPVTSLSDNELKYLTKYEEDLEGFYFQELMREKTKRGL